MGGSLRPEWWPRQEMRKIQKRMVFNSNLAAVRTPTSHDPYHALRLMCVSCVSIRSLPQDVHMDYER